MKSFLVVTCAAISLLAASAASATGMPVKAAPAVTEYDWSGVYGGVGAGGIWGSHHRLYFNPYLAAGTYDVGRWNFSDWILDFHGGIQRQFGSWVVGVEAGIALPNRSARASSGQLDRVTFGFLSDLAANQNLSQLLTVGARLGYAWNQWMVYVDGGWAQAALHSGYNFISTGLVRFPQSSGMSRNNGWYAGIGFNYVLYKSTFGDLIGGLEYQHFDVRAANQFVVSPDPGALSYSGDARGDIVRVRFDIKLNPSIGR